MKIQIVSEYVGPNLYASVPAVRARFDPAIAPDWRSGRSVFEFLQPLAGILPDLRVKFGPESGPEAPAVSVCGENSVSLAEIAAQIVIELQKLAGYRVGYAAAFPSGRREISEIVCEYGDLTTCRSAVRLACPLLLGLLPPDDRGGAESPSGFEPVSAVRRYLEQARRQGLDSTTAAIVRAAEDRGIPWFRLHPTHRIVQLGQGKYQRRLVEDYSDRNGVVANEIVSNRAMTASLLASVGLPVANFFYLPSGDRAAWAADKLGYPVLVKPNRKTEQREAFAPLNSPHDVRAAVERVIGNNDLAIVEKLVDGNRYRMLVSGGELAAAAKTGDRVVDVMDDVHPDNRNLAIQAAAAIGLDVAGIEFVTQDIARSYLEAGGAICGIDRPPDPGLHRAVEGAKRDPDGSVLDKLYPNNAEFCVPIAAITGTNGKTTTSYMLAHIHQCAGKCVGLCSTVGVSVGGHLIRKGDLAGWGGAGMVLANPNTEVAVLETAHGGLIDHGLAVRSCDVGAVLNVTADHLGNQGIETVEEMARVKSVVVRSATGTAVLNADDALCLAMAEETTAEHLCLVTMHPENARVLSHIEAGGRAAMLETPENGAKLVLYDHGERLRLMPVDAVPAAYGGAARHNIENALFAAAMAYGMGRTVEEIRTGLATFDCRHDAIPGRANVYDKHPFKVVVDFAHNPGALEAVGRMVDALNVDGRRICVFTSPSDRNDAHLNAMAHTAAAHFDFFICRQSAVVRGADNDVSAKLRDALTGLGIAQDRIFVIPDHDEAVMAGLKMAKPGDVLFIKFSSRPDNRVWQMIEAFDPDAVEEG